MAGHVRYTAALDACVLFPAPVADALMSLHVAGMYTAKWTRRIEDEWVQAVLRDKPHLDGKIQRRRDGMREAVLDWEIPAEAYEPLQLGLKLPDPGDVHVLAAAIAGHADCIVTANMKDFPAAVMERHGIEVIHPDDFLVFQLDLDPFPALAAFKEMRARMCNPPRGVEEFAQSLERCSLATTAQRLRDAADLI
jgi:predicted nucleic acid-binding protein